MCQEIRAGEAGTDEFPLAVWQTGSGTQTNMNVNEVIAHYGNGTAGESLAPPQRPREHAPRAPTTPSPPPCTSRRRTALEEQAPARAWSQLAAASGRLEEENAGIVKIGPHPSAGRHAHRASRQEISGWRGMLEDGAGPCCRRLCRTLQELALGGTAVGTGLNAPEGFDEMVCRRLSRS